MHLVLIESSSAELVMAGLAELEQGLDFCVEDLLQC